MSYERCERRGCGKNGEFVLLYRTPSFLWAERIRSGHGWKMKETGEIRRGDHQVTSIRSVLGLLFGWHRNLPEMRRNQDQKDDEQTINESLEGDE